MTDTALNDAIAVALGYTHAGTFRGHEMYHPPGVRTTVVTLPDYVHDWNLVIPLVLRSSILETLIAGLRCAEDDGSVTRRAVCETLLAVLQRETVAP